MSSQLFVVSASFRLFILKPFPFFLLLPNNSEKLKKIMKENAFRGSEKIWTWLEGEQLTAIIDQYQKKVIIPVLLEVHQNRFFDSKSVVEIAEKLLSNENLTEFLKSRKR